MRIVSLLPALSELVCALGHGNSLVGVSHECDHPAELMRLPRVTRGRIDVNDTSAAIDAQVADATTPLYELDTTLLRELKPDLVLTQHQCAVCALDASQVRQLAEALPVCPRVESFDPRTMAGVFAMFQRVGALLSPNALERASVWIERVQQLKAEIARRRAGLDRPSLLYLEWVDPPFAAGHWIPEIIEWAGGLCCLGETGKPSRRCTWAEVAERDPSFIILAPCGFVLERAYRELALASARPEWRELTAVREGRVVVADGNAYFSRPGPRLEDSLRILAAVLDRERCGDLAPAVGWEPVKSHSSQGTDSAA